MDILGKNAKEASFFLMNVSTDKKNALLMDVAELLKTKQKEVLKANDRDMVQARESGLKGAILDRLKLDEKRIHSMAVGLEEIAALDDPVGEVNGLRRRPNGLYVGQKRVPIGVVGIIYEARPNVTADVFGLCLKTGNAAILRGGKEAFNSNQSIVGVIREAVNNNGFPEGTLQLVQDTSRESARYLMKMNQYLDVLIPRGGAGLIRTVVENSSVPVIETGVGNCHVYIDEFADPQKAVSIAVNSKVQRPGVCNAAESLLIHRDVATAIVPAVAKSLLEHRVEIRGDPEVCKLVPEAKPASEEDWGTEYLDLIISVGIVNTLDDAIDHIHKYGTGHTEAIVTENYTHAQRFLEEVDAAAVFVNASTRFTDGFEFGFGAEIGISTQKLHARGPMGLRELTTTKYIIYGSGQIRT